MLDEIFVIVGFVMVFVILFCLLLVNDDQLMSVSSVLFLTDLCIIHILNVREAGTLTLQIAQRKYPSQ